MPPTFSKINFHVKIRGESGWNVHIKKILSRLPHALRRTIGIIAYSLLIYKELGLDPFSIAHTKTIFQEIGATIHVTIGESSMKDSEAKDMQGKVLVIGERIGEILELVTISQPSIFNEKRILYVGFERHARERKTSFA